jgi:autotransporter passenger strand-loop-strand repeat protein
VVSYGGYQNVSSGAIASGTTVRAGGRQYVLAHGIGSATTVSNGGAQTVYAGGSAIGTFFSAGGEGVVSSGGVASAITILAGGKEAIDVGGRAVNATVRAGGIDYVLASGSTTGTVVSSGGYELVSSGGVASATRVQSGGLAYINASGVAVGAVVSSGGAETISAGGIASGLSLLAGGVVVDNGEIGFGGAAALDGTLKGSGSIVQAAAGDLVLSGTGAGFSGDAVISGGTIELAAAAALGTGRVTFIEPATGSAVLQIDAADAPAAGGTFANVISNFSGAREDIDLRSIAYVAGASATIVDSTLVLTDGGKTYKFNVAGTTGAYTVTSDGRGGTLIDPPDINGDVARFAQTAAAFAPLDSAKLAAVSATSPTAETLFTHGAGSAGAGHR